jgi:hypothetical protein
MNKMKMVKKDGKMVPSFAADGMGKMAKGGLAKRGEGIATKGFAKGGIAKSGVPEGGKISASGSDAAGPTATVLTQPVKKSVTGDRVQVRGVGAARARSARIY